MFSRPAAGRKHGLRLFKESHWLAISIQKGFFVNNAGYEYNLVLAVAALALAFTGSGSISIDALLNYRESGTS